MDSTPTLEEVLFVAGAAAALFGYVYRQRLTEWKARHEAWVAAGDRSARARRRRRTGTPQLVGATCDDCAEDIVFEADGTRCFACKGILHLSCAQKHVCKNARPQDGGHPYRRP
jgi:hypothetical protein